MHPLRCGMNQGQVQGHYLVKSKVFHEPHDPQVSTDLRFHSPQADSVRCQTMDTGVVYRAVCLFIPRGFLPCDAVCTVSVIVILSVRPSVSLSVCLSHSWTVSTWFDLRS